MPDEYRLVEHREIDSALLGALGTYMNPAITEVTSRVSLAVSLHRPSDGAWWR